MHGELLQEEILMIDVDRRYAGRCRTAVYASAALLCLPVIAAYGSTATLAPEANPAGTSMCYSGGDRPARRP
jgi:hypothetical protein